MPQGQEKLTEFSPQERELASNLTLLTSMVTAKREELRSIQHQVLLSETRLNQLKQQHEEQLSAHARTLQIERNNHEKGLEQDRLVLRQRDAELATAARNIELQQQEIDNLKVETEPIRKMKEELTTDRIAVETLRSQVAEVEQHTSAVAQDYAQRMIELVAREKELEQEEIRVQVLSQQSDALKREADQSVAQAVLERTQLEKLREDLDPRLKEIAQKQADLSEQEPRVKAFHAEALQKTAENAQLHADLQGRAQQLDAKEQVLLDLQTRLRSFAQELTVKAQQAKAKGVEIGEVPAEPKVL